MNLEKMSRSLRRELTRNPKKSSILGIMCLIALYFWAPLIWKWTQRETTADSPSVAATMPVVPVAEPTTTVNPSAKRKPRTKWHELAEWIKQDRMMESANAETIHNPFETALALARDASQSAGETLLAGAGPEQLGLVLNGTIIGRRRSATINGRSFGQGEDVVGLAEQTNAAFSFKLVTVGYNFVVLERDGSQFMLRMAERQLSGSDRIELVTGGIEG